MQQEKDFFRLFSETAENLAKGSILIQVKLRTEIPY